MVWCGSGGHGEGGTNLTAQGVVVTVTSEEKNKVSSHLQKITLKRTNNKSKISRV